MTSLRRELAPEPAAGLRCVRKRIAFHFALAHGRRQRLVSPRRLGIDTANTSGLAGGRASLEIASPERERVPA